MQKSIKILLIILFTFQTGIAQKDSLNFEISSNYIDGKPYLNKTRTVANSNSKLDVYFFKKHFGLFYRLPKDLIKKRFKNREITEWHFKDRKKDFKENWTETFKYDSAGRLIEYRHSGCEICSSFKGGYKLTYNEKNEIIVRQQYWVILNEDANGNSVDSKSLWKDDITSTLKLTYDDHRNIIRVEEFGRNKLLMVIELIR